MKKEKRIKLISDHFGQDIKISDSLIDPIMEYLELEDLGEIKNQSGDYPIIKKDDLINLKNKQLTQ